MSDSPTPDDTTTQAKERYDYAPKDEEEAEDDQLAPSRWWFFTTLFPLVAATFGPLATAFNICALTQDLRIIVDPSTTLGSTEAEGIEVSDPAWSTALLAVSLVLAVIANIALLLHMLGRVSFTVAQPITITGWYIGSFLLIGLVGAAPSHLPLPAGEARTFSQAFYYACFAAALYFIMATAMAVTAWSVYASHISKEFKLTMAQRTLMLQVCLFLGYLLCAAAVYTRIEGLEYLDAVYWVDVTLFTIGFGDYHPNTHLGRGLFFPMAVGGILFVGLIVASISSVVLERGTNKITRRNVEKARQKLLKQKGHQVGKHAASELDRGEQEFNLVRQAQRNANRTNIAIAVGISAGSWLFLWIIGGVVFWQAELSTQGWSYFEALYFTYVSFTTIGYGDFYPQNSAAKPAFVFWSMLALPTLTVLIGAIGSSISEGVSTITLLIGEKLPPKTPGLAALKGTANKVKKGDDGAFKSAKPPGFMEDDGGEAQRIGSDRTMQAVQGLGEDLHPDGDSEKSSIGEKYRGYLLMKELKNVSDHCDASPPRKYTYAEWVWFLQLLGEDEKDWSWHGKTSPLMESGDEPKWVLERLMSKLEEELKSHGDEETGRI